MDEACKLIKGPMVLLDANNKVLGITSRYGKDDIDHEWKYLWEYGFSSLNAIRYMSQNSGSYQMSLRGQQPFRWGANSMLNHSGISSCMYFNNVCCGRINLLARDRELNRGDMQLLSYISELLEPNLGQLYFGNVLRSSSNVFLNLLTEKPYEAEKLERQLAYHQWTMEGTYQLALIRLREEAQKELYLQAVSQLVSVHITGAEVLHSYPYVMILSDRDLLGNAQYSEFFTHLICNNPVEIGFSLPIAGLSHGAVLYQQARYALSRGSTVAPELRQYRFEDYAVDYLILSSAPLEVKLFACMPQVVALWKERMQKQDTMFETLEQYLDHERSISKTSQAMFLHKNTGAYRIKKLESLLGSGLDDPTVRKYCQLSLMVLRLYEKSPAAYTHPLLTDGGE